VEHCTAESGARSSWRRMELRCYRGSGPGDGDGDGERSGPATREREEGRMVGGGRGGGGECSVGEQLGEERGGT
jgi:hypothetical protein